MAKGRRLAIRLKCTEASFLLSQAQERALGRGERTVLRVHTWMCSGCRQFGVQLGWLRQAAQAFAAGQMPGSVELDRRAGDAGSAPDDEDGER